MRNENEFKRGPSHGRRELLEAENKSLAKKIQRNKTVLISPYSTFYSALLLPMVLYLLLEWSNPGCTSPDVCLDQIERSKEPQRDTEADFENYVKNFETACVTHPERAKKVEVTAVMDKGLDYFNKYLSDRMRKEEGEKAAKLFKLGL